MSTHMDRPALRRHVKYSLEVAESLTAEANIHRARAREIARELEHLKWDSHFYRGIIPIKAIDMRLALPAMEDALAKMRASIKTIDDAANASRNAARESQKRLDQFSLARLVARISDWFWPFEILADIRNGRKA